MHRRNSAINNFRFYKEYMRMDFTPKIIIDNSTSDRNITLEILKDLNDKDFENYYSLFLRLICSELNISLTSAITLGELVKIKLFGIETKLNKHEFFNTIVDGLRDMLILTDEFYNDVIENLNNQAPETRLIIIDCLTRAKELHSKESPVDLDGIESLNQHFEVQNVR